MTGWKNRPHILVLAAAFMLAATASWAAEPTGAGFYKDKTITYIVSTGPGGGHDLYARLMARNMERFLPGATIVVKNVPGAGHIIGANEIYNSKPDGLTIGTFSTGLSYAQIIGLDGVKFDFTKMSWIGKQATDTRVLFMSKKSGFLTWKDVQNAKRQIKLGTSGVGSGAYNESYMISHAFNLNVRVLAGYQGGEAIMGMMRGDFDGRVGGFSSQQEGGDTGTGGVGQVVLQFGDPDLPDIPDGAKLAKTPLQQAVARMMIGEGQLYRVVVGPPGIPKDRLQALRTAFAKALTSKEYRAEAEKGHRPYDKVPVPADKVQQMAADIVTLPPEMVALLKEITKAKPKLVKHQGPVTKLEDGNRKISINYKGVDVAARVSGSRTAITVGGKKARRDDVKVGMSCQFTYPAAGAEAEKIDCK